MLAQLEALDAVAQLGTVSAAARRLRLTQGAVTKRLQALEREIGEALIERNGRGVVLTPRGASLLADVGPLLADLKRALDIKSGAGQENASVAFSESLLASWGAVLIADLSQERPEIDWTLHAHRSPLVIDRVRSGEAGFGICAGLTDESIGLSRVDLGEEELVILPAAERKLSMRGRRKLEVMTIEMGSATWRSIRHRLRSGGFELIFAHRVQSFTAVVALARAGVAHGLVPRGLAISMGSPANTLVSIPRGGLTRPIQLIARTRTLASPLGAWFRDTVSEKLRGPDSPIT